MNTIAIQGNVVKDAVVKQAGNTNVLEVTVADNVGFGDKKTTNFFRVVKFQKADPSKLADILTKGKSVFVTGEFKASPYKDKEGNDRMSLEIYSNSINLISSGNGGGNGGGGSNYNSQPSTPSPAPSTTPAPSPETDEDMPF